MQSETPKLPLVCSDGKKRSARDTELIDESSTLGLKSHNSTCKILSNLVSNRKQLHPLVGQPYRNSMRLYALSEPVRSTNKTSVIQRVMSAKMLRVKQLQNQLTDAHYHLNELANENRLLKALQKRQDSALRKYEGTNAELPRIINSHHEELKVLQTKHKKLRSQHKQTCDLLKEKENEIHTLQSQNKYLVQLSKDRHLEERDKLQTRVSDLNFRIQQQQETIQTLNRKLALESKSLKHQLNVEVSKHKETQKHLHEALEKLKNLEDLLDNREKRLYYSGRLPVCHKGKTMESQSLMNLGQNGVPPNPLKAGSKSRGLQRDLENGSLPKLNKAEPNEGKTIPILKDDETEETITETMSSLQQVRNFRLQKSYSRNSSSSLVTDLNKSEEEDRNEINGVAKYSNIEKLRAKRATMNEIESDDEEIEKNTENLTIPTTNGPYNLARELTREFRYSSSDSDSEEEAKDHEKFETDSLASKSRDLHTRLIADEMTIIRHSVSSQIYKKENATNTSESESDAEDRVTSLSTTAENDKSANRSGSRNSKGNIDAPLDDFLKLEMNAIDSNFETKKPKKISVEALERSLDATENNSSAERRENTQQRLLTITKSWTELQTKIKRDRETQENQLKALNEEILEDEFLSEKKLSSAQDDDKFSKERSVLDAKFPQAEEHFQGPEIRDNDLSTKTDSADSGRTSMDGKELATVTKNTEGTTDAPSLESPGKITENGIAHDENTGDARLIDFNKQKLLAAMKAIDDNENIEFLTNRKYRTPNTAGRSQSSVTENLYRGIPTHGRKKNDLIKEIFGDTKVETKLRAGCSKLH